MTLDQANDLAEEMVWDLIDGGLILMGLEREEGNFASSRLTQSEYEGAIKDAGITRQSAADIGTGRGEVQVNEQPDDPPGATLDALTGEAQTIGKRRPR